MGDKPKIPTKDKVSRAFALFGMVLIPMIVCYILGWYLYKVDLYTLRWPFVVATSLVLTGSAIGSNVLLQRNDYTDGSISLLTFLVFFGLLVVPMIFVTLFNSFVGVFEDTVGIGFMNTVNNSFDHLREMVESTQVQTVPLPEGYKFPVETMMPRFSLYNGTINPDGTLTLDGNKVLEDYKIKIRDTSVFQQLCLTKYLLGHATWTTLFLFTSSVVSTFAIMNV